MLFFLLCLSFGFSSGTLTRQIEGRHHLVEVDNCHKINLTKTQGSYFTAICKPEGEDWFFRKSVIRQASIRP